MCHPLALISGMICLVLAQHAPADKKSSTADDLAKRLLKEKESPVDVFDQILMDMEKSEKRLARNFDPGPNTQRAQQRVIDALDDAIAASIRNPSRGKSSQGRKADPRRKPGASEVGREGDGKGDVSGSAASGGSSVPGKAQELQEAASAGLLESRRGWGHLPARDRDEVIQGSGEKYMPDFQDWIERYYRKLAERDTP